MGIHFTFTRNMQVCQCHRRAQGMTLKVEAQFTFDCSVIVVGLQPSYTGLPSSLASVSIVGMRCNMLITILEHDLTIATHVHTNTS